MRIVLLISVFLNLVLFLAIVLLSPKEPPRDIAGAPVSERPADNTEEGVVREAVVAVASDSAPRFPNIPPVPPPPDASADRSRSLATDLVAQGWSIDDARALAIGILFQQSLKERIEYRDRREYWEPIPRHERRELIQNHGRRLHIAAELVGLRGPSILDVEGGSIPMEKVQAIARLRDDTEQLRMIFAPQGEGIELPEDLEVRERIETAMQQEIEALLSPEELTEYRLRHSSKANTLRSHLALVETSESEFRALFELWEKADRTERAPHAADDKTQHDKANEVELEIRELLGEERFRQWERNRNGNYQDLLRLAHRLEISREDVNRAHDRAERAVEERNELILQQMAGELSPEGLREAETKMGAELRRDLSEILGEEGLEHYPRYGGGILRAFPQKGTP